MTTSHISVALATTGLYDAGIRHADLVSRTSGGKLRFITDQALALVGVALTNREAIEVARDFQAWA